jgi:DNA-directed RNA polymerase specialized sigma24 family protein
MSFEGREPSYSTRVTGPTGLGNAPARKLVARLRAGDEYAFHVFFDTCFDPLFHYAMHRFDGDLDRSRALAQATLVQAMRELNTFRGDISLFVWVFRIADRELAHECA